MAMIVPLSDSKSSWRMMNKMTWEYLKLKGKEKLEWALSELRSELHKGVHTYHQCECGRSTCRSNMCIYCWMEEILKLKSELQKVLCPFCNKPVHIDEAVIETEKGKKGLKISHIKCRLKEGQKR